MKIISKTIKLLPVFLLVLGLTGCSDDDDNGPIVLPTPNIVELASSNANLSSLVAALQAADGNLVDVLSGPGPFTVLAPTNDAFDTYLNGTPLDQVDSAVLSQILLNHVIAGEVRAADLVALSDAQGRGYASTSADGAGGQNLSILFDTFGSLPRFNNTANVVSADLADIEASNGVVHVIDAVLPLPDVVDHALNNDNFTSLTGALVSENLVGALQADGPFTVFAPTNDAFGDFTNPSSNPLSNILLNHVMNGATLSTDLVNAGAGYASTLANGPMDLNSNMTNLSLYYNTSDGVIINGGSEVIATDIVGTNGIIHVVDAVIDIPTVVTFAVADPSFSTLVSALTTLTPSVDFAGILSTADGTSPAPFTVFAPTNAAFDQLPAIPAEADLIPILQHHVVTGSNAVSGDLTPDGTTPLPTLQGDNIIISLPGTAPNIADVEDGAGNTDIGIIAVDVQAGNGVIHVLNKVLLPSAE